LNIYYPSWKGNGLKRATPTKQWFCSISTQE